MRVSVCLGAILIPKYLDFHSGYSAPRSRIAGIYSRIYSYSGISQTNVPLNMAKSNWCTCPRKLPTGVTSPASNDNSRHTLYCQRSLTKAQCAVKTETSTNKTNLKRKQYKLKTHDNNRDLNL